jgi:hypothetical protein
MDRQVGHFANADVLIENGTIREVRPEISTSDVVTVDTSNVSHRRGRRRSVRLLFLDGRYRDTMGGVHGDRPVPDPAWHAIRATGRRRGIEVLNRAAAVAKWDKRSSPRRDQRGDAVTGLREHDGILARNGNARSQSSPLPINCSARNHIKIRDPAYARVEPRAAVLAIWREAAKPTTADTVPSDASGI